MRYKRVVSPEGRKKMSAAKLGKPLPHNRGENHWNWKGGVSSENDTIRDSLEYQTWRRAVYERDNYTCQECGIRPGCGKAVYLHAHHIKSFALHVELRLDINNGQTLCEHCHRLTDNYGTG
jgi:hypothetical protein